MRHSVFRFIVLSIFAIAPAVPVVAAPLQVGSVDCANAQNGQDKDTTGDPVTADTSPSVSGKIEFYEDLSGGADPASESIFAPSGWECQADFGPHGYNLDVVPHARGFPDAGDLPIVNEQVVSQDGAVQDAVNFELLAIPLFPKFYAEDVFTSVRDTMSANGENVTRAQIAAWVSRGPRDIITYKSDRIVEFMTPAHTHGLGTLGDAGKQRGSRYPTYGVVGIVFLDNGMPETAEIIEIRLPSNLAYLQKPLLKLAEDKIRQDSEN